MTKKKAQVKSSFRIVRPFWKKNLIGALIIVICCLGIYLPSTSYDFVLDDQMVITDNTFTKEGLKGIPKILNSEGFTGYFGEQKDLVAGSRYRPMSMVVFAVLHEFFGLNGKAYHLMNIFLYTLLCLLIFRVGHIYFPKYKSPHPLLGLAFICSLFYALHPVHVEAVANIKGMDEVLAMIGSVGMLYFTALYIKNKKFYWLIFSGLSFFFGLLSKETTITFFAVLPLLMYFFTKEKIKSYLITLIPLFIAFAAYLFMRIDAIGFLFSKSLNIIDPMNNPFVDMSLAQKSSTIMYTLGEYLRLMSFPMVLTHDYYPYHVPIMEWSDWQSLLSLALYVLLALAGIYGLFKKKLYGFCIAFFVATISIASNIVIPIGTFMNERFLFMPSWGYCLFLAYFLLYWLPKRMNKTPVSKILSIGLVIAFATFFLVRSVVRVPVWKDAYSLNAAAIKVSKNSARANVFMGTALYKRALQEKDRAKKREMLEEVDDYMDKAISILPKYLNANLMKAGALGQIFNMNKDFDRLSAGFKDVCTRRPDVSYLYEYFDYLNRRHSDSEELMNLYFDISYNTLYLNPETRNLKYAEKIAQYGLKADPTNARLNYVLALIYTTYKKNDIAQQYLDVAKASDPDIKQKFNR